MVQRSAATRTNARGLASQEERWGDDMTSPPLADKGFDRIWPAPDVGDRVAGD
jgi:hypothetical protein